MVKKLTLLLGLIFLGHHLNKKRRKDKKSHVIDMTNHEGYKWQR